ncbi:MAG: right-handed parallel beta-helix repeat-containing protein [Akkermansiaceae bacterium]|jgi:hypothetical protein|nr:right-handed parallel beta-helix repeat-containing protein [Akkermansiaceae bacterium]
MSHTAARPSLRIPLLPIIGSGLIAALVFLTACGDTKEDPPAATLPEKVVLQERSEDLRALIDKELAAGNKRIVIPQGRYRVQAQRGGHLHFSNLADVEIIAENVELVCTSTVRALMFEDCTNVTLRGLTVDYDPLPFTQGKIIAMAPDKSWLDFEVAKGYPENQLKERIQIYDPVSGVLRRGDARWSQEIEALGGHRYRVKKEGKYQFDPDQDTEQIGDILVTNNAFHKPGSPHAIELRGCKNMRFEDITLFASPSFGFFERNCNGSSFLRCIVDRRDPADDPVKRAQPRMRSLNADAFHSKDAAKGPAIIACKAHFQGDDCVNINGRYHYVRGSKGREVRIAISDQATTIEVGDPIEFLPYSGPRPPDAVVVKKQPDSMPITDEEKAFIRKLRLDERIRTELLDGEAEYVTLTLDRDVALPAGSALCCPLRIGNGFAVKDCDFGHNRSRGILIKASKGEVSGNRITNSRMAAVLVSPEFWWMEAGCPSDLIIQNNIIQGSLQTPIQIHARSGNGRTLPAGTLRNISILNNRIEDCAWPLIHVTSTSNLTIKGNIFPDAPSKPSEPVLLENCVVAD